MANAFAMIDESLWRRDRDFRALPRDAQCTFLQLLSQRDVDCAGILTLHIDFLAKGCDEITTEDVSRDLKTLETRRFIYADDDTDELLIRSYARRVSARSPNALKAALKAAKTVSSSKLRAVLAYELRRLDRADATAVADQIDPGETYSHNPSERDTEGIPEPIGNLSERGNPSGRDPEPPSCSSVVDQLSPPIDGQEGGSRTRTHTREAAEPTPTPNPPPRFCPNHNPDGPPPGTNCGPCGDARRQHDRWLTTQDIATKTAAQEHARSEATQRAAATETKLNAIQACDLCDDDGYRGSTVCDHTDRTQTTRTGIAQVRAALTKKPHPTLDDEPPPT